MLKNSLIIVVMTSRLEGVNLLEIQKRYSGLRVPFALRVVKLYQWNTSHYNDIKFASEFLENLEESTYEQVKGCGHNHSQSLNS